MEKIEKKKQLKTDFEYFLCKIMYFGMHLKDKSWEL